MSRFSLGTRPSAPDPRTAAAVPPVDVDTTGRSAPSVARQDPTVLSAWRTSPARLARLVVGLWIFGTGDALIVRSDLGNSPWTVFAEGVSIHTPLSIGVASIVIGFFLLLIWIPLRTRLGLGTLLNIVVIGVAIDATLLMVPEIAPIGGRIGVLLAGLALIGLGSGLYLGTAHGPGPRDGLMTGLHDRTGLPVGVVRGHRADGVDGGVVPRRHVRGGHGGLRAADRAGRPDGHRAGSTGPRGRPASTPRGHRPDRLKCW